MQRYGVPTEEIWISLTRDERARKVGAIMAEKLIGSIQSFEAYEDSKRKH